MKPTRYDALRRAVDETLDVSEEQWDDIDERVKDIRSR